MKRRDFRTLDNLRLLNRGNKILQDLFLKSTHSIRQICSTEAEAKAFYRFLQNDKISEQTIKDNIIENCKSSCSGKYVVCIQDTTEINLSSHINRINKDQYIGTTNAKNNQGLGFMLHPCLVVDAWSCVPYGYADIKVWNRPLEFKSKHEREYNKLPIKEKESYKWIETSNNTKNSLSDIVKGMVIVQDREGDIYEQFATVPDGKTDLLIRARTDRTLPNKEKLFSCVKEQPSQETYSLDIEGKGGRKKRKASIEIRFKKVEIKRTKWTNSELTPTVTLYFIEAKEVKYKGENPICWRLLTTIPIEDVQTAKMCIEWYSWRWTIEEVFKILKKEGYNIEASELEYSSSVRKLTLMILEVIIKLFLMRLAYAEPELDLSADSCFNKREQEFLELQIQYFEGKTEKQKNPFAKKDLKRYTWVIARMGGWKGYEWKRHPGITTLWYGLQHFKSSIQGWELNRIVSTR